MSQQEIIYSIALTKMKRLSLLNARILLDELGSASEVFANRKDIKSVLPDANDRLVEALSSVDDAMREAEKEMKFVESKNIKVLLLNDDAYPQRLKECEDSPLVLYYFGEADLNRAKVISIIGTRECTAYGKEVCSNFVADLKKSYPDVLIISGLAYGIDINAHRAALNNGIDTVGVLAHGLDRVYPSMHRHTAADMVHAGGGLITEYTSGTTPERMNFIRRNRIVAGLCDACVVVESAAKGGSLITADLALNYNREVFAFPGRVYDEYSSGCNMLIKNHRATLITNAEDMIEAMGWENTKEKKGGNAVQMELFPEMSEGEMAIVGVLKNVDDKHINQIVIDTNMSYSKVSMMLFDMEMKGVVMALGGARFRLRRKM